MDEKINIMKFYGHSRQICSYSYVTVDLLVKTVKDCQLVPHRNYTPQKDLKNYYKFLLWIFYFLRRIKVYDGITAYWMAFSWSWYYSTEYIGRKGGYICFFFNRFQSMSLNQGWFITYSGPPLPNRFWAFLWIRWFTKSTASSDHP